VCAAEDVSKERKSKDQTGPDKKTRTAQVDRRNVAEGGRTTVTPPSKDREKLVCRLKEAAT